MLVVANDNSDKSRRGFVDRYLEIVLHRVQVVGSETGETLLCRKILKDTCLYQSHMNGYYKMGLNS